jgi:hypothetical protein
VKYDSDGNELWMARYPGGAGALVLDANANVYVTGGSAGDFATLKYDSDGNQLWAARYHGPGNGGAQAIALDADGNVYVTGTSEDVDTSRDYATVKYDSEGNQLWAALYQGRGFTAAAAIAVDAVGNAYVTGSTGSDVITYAYDYATVKYDSDGNQQWATRYRGLYFNIPAAIAVDAVGNSYVTGYTGRDVGSYDYATVKYDSDGNQRWVVRYNGPDNLDDYANAMALDASGNVFVTGVSCTEEAMDGCASADFATVKYAQQ